MYVLSGASWARSGGQGLPGRVGDTGLATRRGGAAENRWRTRSQEL